MGLQDFKKKGMKVEIVSCRRVEISRESILKMGAYSHKAYEKKTRSHEQTSVWNKEIHCDSLLMEGKLLIVATVLMDGFPSTKIHAQLTTRDVKIVNAQDILTNIVEAKIQRK